MSDIPEVDDFLAHYGVKGMRWGVRRPSTELKTYSSIKEAEAAVKAPMLTKRESKLQVKALRSRDARDMAEAKKDSRFKEEVKLAKKGEGLARQIHERPVRFEYLKGGRLSGRMNADFSDSKGRKVSVEFANSVLDKAVNDQTRNANIQAGAVFATSVLAIVGSSLIRKV